ncbi:MAG: hypothetical protein ACI9O6_000485 [Glaciecola sp.]|jgi:hypothetical protein
MEASRDGAVPEFSLWEPFAWEITSALSTFLLVPILVWWFKLVPLSLTHFKRFLALHLGATLIYSALHVGLMVLFRELIYKVMGGNYDFGDVLSEFFYEYRKDAFGYFFFMALYYAYRFIYSRLKGEASFINEQEHSKPSAPEHFLVRKLDKEFLVKVLDIDYLESAGNYVNLYVAGRIYPLRSTLSGLIPRLAERGFMQIHRSYAVNLNKVQSIESLSSGDAKVYINDSISLPLSRRYKDKFKQQLQ